MEYNRRKEVIEYLILLESKFPVHKWIVNEIHIWPLLKHILFIAKFKEINNTFSKVGKRNDNIFYYYLYLLVSKFFDVFYFVKTLFLLSPKDYIFAASLSHRVYYNNKFINRFFDPLMDKFEEEGKNSILVEYDPVINKDKFYKGSRVVDGTRLCFFFKRKYRIEASWDKLINEWPEFQLLLDEISSSHLFEINEIKKEVEKRIESILNWKRFFRWMLKLTGAKTLIGLCYYSNALYGANLACRSLGIKSIDMQHGAQGDLHFAYNYKVFPKNGYSILPEVFWVWDDIAYDYLDSILKNQWYHKVVLKGNTWISFIKESLNDFSIVDQRPIILVTVQPLNEVLSFEFLEVIRLTMGSYSWWIRLHPRMNDSQIELFKSDLERAGVLSDVNIEDATSLPLPLILLHSKLHISKYSGSITEAAMLGIPSLILDKIGLEIFSNYLLSNLCIDGTNQDSSQLIDILKNIIQ